MTEATTTTDDEQASNDLAEAVQQHLGSEFGDSIGTFTGLSIMTAKASADAQGIELHPAIIGSIGDRFMNGIATLLADFMDELVSLGCYPNMAASRPWRADDAGFSLDDEDGTPLYTSAATRARNAAKVTA